MKLLCIAMWIGLVVAGLWPFNFFPRNKVEWLQNRNGIHFSGNGQLYSSEHWNTPEAKSLLPLAHAFSIEVWLQTSDPDYGDVSNIVTIYRAHRENFAVAQSIYDLVLQGQFRHRNGAAEFKRIYLDRAFYQAKVRFLTVVSDASGTQIYLEGARVRDYPDLTLSSDNFSGTMLVGHSPVRTAPWSGDVFALAIYSRSLSPAQVAEHYRAWSKGQTRELQAQAGLLSMYLFDERSGTVVHNHGSMPDLVVPQKFFLLQRTRLDHSLKLDRSGLLDIIVNIIGFISFGWVFSTYLRRCSGYATNRVMLLTLVVGLGTSFLIELFQAYLPTRDSSLIDLINNGIGTLLGALLIVVFHKRIRPRKSSTAPRFA